MNLIQRMGNGLALCRKSLMVVLRDKTLLWFPLISLGIILVTVWMFYISVGPNKLQLLVNKRVNDIGVELLNYGYYLTVFITYLVLSSVAVFCNTALAACAHISMTERDSVLQDGNRAALRSLPSILLWSLLASTIGVLLGLLDREKHLSRLIRRVLGSGWSVLTALVIPIIVVERRTIFTALPRSASIMKATWGENASAHTGAGWFFLLLNLPVAALLAAEYYTANLTPFIFLLTITWTFFTIVLVTAARHVLIVVLYLHAVGETPAGWDAARLNRAFLAGDSPLPVAADNPAPDADLPDADDNPAPEDASASGDAPPAS